MKRTLPIALLAAALPLAAAVAEPVTIAQDDATQSAYGGGWNNDSNGGHGFGPWTLRNLKADDAPNGESHSGFFIAIQDANSDMSGAAIGQKAFGLFANGHGFEVAAAFRAFDKPLAPGDTFSFLLEGGLIERKFGGDDSAEGSFGLTLRAASDVAGTDSFNADARFEFGFYEGGGNYKLFDAEGEFDTGIEFNDAGVSVAVTLKSADEYDLEVTTLADKKTTRFAGRRFGGSAGAPITAFCAFNRDGEKADTFFNGFQVDHGER